MRRIITLATLSLSLLGGVAMADPNRGERRDDRREERRPVEHRRDERRDDRRDERRANEPRSYDRDRVYHRGDRDDVRWIAGHYQWTGYQWMWIPGHFERMGR
jgi:hypothetical protein